MKNQQISSLLNAAAVQMWTRVWHHPAGRWSRSLCFLPPKAKALSEKELDYSSKHVRTINNPNYVRELNSLWSSAIQGGRKEHFFFKNKFHEILSDISFPLYSLYLLNSRWHVRLKQWPWRSNIPLSWNRLSAHRAAPSASISCYFR